MAKAVLYDSNLCVGCRFCEAACSEKWKLPYTDEIAATEKTSAQKLTTVTPTENGFRASCACIAWTRLARACVRWQHSRRRRRARWCTTKKCMGCRYCLMACPFQVPSYEWNERLPLVKKCDMCAERVDFGGVTHCSEACPFEATITGERDDLIAIAKERMEASPGEYHPAIYGLKEVGGTSVLMIGAEPFEQAEHAGNLPKESLPTYTWAALKHVPDVVMLGTVLMGGVYWITTAARKWRPPKEAKMSRFMPRTFWQWVFAALMVAGLYATYIRSSMGWAGRRTCRTSSPGGSGSDLTSCAASVWPRAASRWRRSSTSSTSEEFKPMVRPAILTAFLGYVLVVVALMFDLGQPHRVWHPLVMWNPRSVMFEVGWCVTLYTTVLFLEFLPVVLEKFGPEAAAAGAARA
jgi:formate dehydrogenase iron-sulfur subunit